jgi:hypothetical protein
LAATLTEQGIPQYGTPPRFISIKGEPRGVFGWVGSRGIFLSIGLFLAVDLLLGFTYAGFPTWLPKVP